MNYEEKTQRYSTWGDKYLQHTDVLHAIQYDDTFKPINIQLAPMEMCDSDCPFCSVAARPLKSYMPFPQIEEMLTQFKALGAKALEISGGGNPLLYRDKDNNKNINDVIRFAGTLGMDVGIITNTEKLERHLDPSVYRYINWIRVSLIKLDEGKTPEDYDFGSFPTDRIGLSYIIYETTGTADILSRTGRAYKGTTPESIRKIARLIELNPSIKFCRIAGNALVEGAQVEIQKSYRPIIETLDSLDKFFIKDVWEDTHAFSDGCYVGLTRPYIAPNPETGGDYQVYICTSHVLEHRTYDLNFSLGSASDVKAIWDKCNLNYAKYGYPYEVKGNNGSDWNSTKGCGTCLYYNNNRLLHTVAQPMDDDDRNFA